MRMINILKQLFSSQTRSSAGSNATLLRMIVQALPMYFLPNSYSFPPLSLLLIVNSICNLRCKICDVGQKNVNSIFYKSLISTSPEDMSLESYKKIVNQVSKSTFISITSTEPLLWKPLNEAIRWTAENGWQLNVTTNGFLLPLYASELVEANLHKLSVSIDGSQEIHNNARGSNKSYQNAIEGIQKIAKCREKSGIKNPMILINTVLSPLNQGTITDFLKALPLENIRQVSLELMTFCTSDIAEIHNETFGKIYPASETCLSGGIDPKSMNIDLVLEDIIKAKTLFPDKLLLRFPLNSSHPEIKFSAKIKQYT